MAGHSARVTSHPQDCGLGAFQYGARVAASCCGEACGGQGEPGCLSTDSCRLTGWGLSLHKRVESCSQIPLLPCSHRSCPMVAQYGWADDAPRFGLLRCRGSCLEMGPAAGSLCMARCPHRTWDTAQGLQPQGPRRARELPQILSSSELQAASSLTQGPQLSNDPPGRHPKLYPSLATRPSGEPHRMGPPLAVSIFLKEARTCAWLGPEWILCFVLAFVLLSSVVEAPAEGLFLCTQALTCEGAPGP